MTLVILVCPPTAFDSGSTCRRAQADSRKSHLHAGGLFSGQEPDALSADQYLDGIWIEAIGRVGPDRGDALVFDAVASMAAALSHDRPLIVAFTDNLCRERARSPLNVASLGQGARR